MDFYTRVQNSGKFAVSQGKIYHSQDDRWDLPSDVMLPILIRGYSTEQENMALSSGDIKEVISRMEQDPQIQITFVDDEHQHYVRVSNGIFNVEKGQLEAPSGGMEFSYYLDFEYIAKENRRTPCFDNFLQTSFPYDVKTKKQLLEEILGYVISDYMTAKAGFFFIGESNSGKSTVLEIIRKVVPNNRVTGIPLYRLGNRFALGRLSESRINISTELSEKSFQSADIFKMLTSCEMITGEHKGKKPFEFRMKCKCINAGNVIPKLGNIDGMEAIFNRMVILYFPRSIPKKEQDLYLLEKLEQEKNAIFSNALDALVELRKREFRFTIPEDSRKLIEQLVDESKAVENFVRERCIMESTAKIHNCEIYEAFKQYCSENLMEILITQNQFLQKISHVKGVTRSKFRINGSAPLAGFLGIRLKTFKDFDREESEALDAATENSAEFTKQNIRKAE